ncbi:MAG: hypothetical protein U0835_04200 [Isosphaeraceae bacterium]
MRKLARIVCTFAGLALLAPSATFAQYPSRSEPAGTASVGKPKHRRGLFAREHLCAQCQAAKVMKRDGVYVPTPPAAPGTVGQGASTCTACGGSTAAAASNMNMMAQSAPVYAQQAAPMEDSGVASVGPEPAAVGAYAPSMAAAGRPACPAPVTPPSCRRAWPRPPSHRSA